MATPNMNLPIPGVGITDGPQYATDNNSCFTLIDAHDHSVGNGVPITPSGINITADLTFNSSYGPTNMKKGAFTSQSAALTGTNFASVVGGNLYFNDGSGNQIPITAGGGVAGSPGSIGSLSAPAAATYSSGSKTFTWTADSGKAAAMDNGAVVIRETNVASAKGVTLQSASALAADYSLTLPAALPASSQYLASSSSGVTSFVTANSIAAAMSSVGANAIQVSTTRSTGTTVGAGGVAISSSSVNFTTTSSSLVDVTNLSVTITTSGRPVVIVLASDASAGNAAYVAVSNASSGSTIRANFAIFRDATLVANHDLELAWTGSTSSAYTSSVPPGSINSVDVVGAGTYTYKLQAKNAFSNTVTVSHCVLVAYEL